MEGKRRTLSRACPCAITKRMLGAALSVIARKESRALHEQELHGGSAGEDTEIDSSGQSILKNLMQHQAVGKTNVL